MSREDEPAVEPTQLRCGELSFVEAVSIGADQRRRVRRRLQTELRWWIAGWVALGLAGSATVYAGVGFAFFALDPDGNYPPPALSLLVAFFAALACTAVAGVPFALLFARTFAVRVAVGVTLTVAVLTGIAAARWNLPILGGLTGVGGLWLAATGVLSLFAVPYAPLTPSHLRSALADLHRGTAWRFEGFVAPEICWESEESEPEEDHLAPDPPIRASILVLPISCVTIDAPTLDVSWMRPIAPPRSPYRRGDELLESRSMLAIERIELASILRHRRSTTVFRAIATTWIVSFVGAVVVAWLDLGRAGIVSALALGLAVAARGVVRRQRAARDLRQDLREGVVVVRGTGDPVEWLPKSCEPWTRTAS